MEESPEETNDGNLGSANETLQVDASKRENVEESAIVVYIIEIKSLPVSMALEPSLE